MKRYLERHKILQKDFAERANVTSQYINDIVHGRRSGGITIAHRLEELTHGEINASIALHTDLEVEIQAWREHNDWNPPKQ